MSDRQELFATGALVPIPADMYGDVFDGSHDIAFTSKAYILALSSRQDGQTISDVVRKMLLMACKRIVSREGHTFVFEVELVGVTHRLVGILREDSDLTILQEGEF